MANVFSTATLGLGVDTSKFIKGMSGAVNVTKTGLNQMRLGAAAFESQWNDMTDGIKDTRRIISGILISQGFYSLMNGLTFGASEALTFARNMETAAVSMEYFVDGADKAAKSLAFLREMNEFAARTPFSTEQALEMSKYIQAVGISMNTSKSFLEVVTDAAAATGATEENLQRVIFALGQMQTKGRIANEEIRQLANANIPIYQILQEELNLTGDQISNIGNYWIDADKAIVAILRGLEKRYDGAADRISDTMSGMIDTIADNSKIIAQAAGQGAYDGLKNVMTGVRDMLDEYRDTVTEFGSAGLFNQILIDIDPTGEVGTQVLTLIGDFRQLGAAAVDLYHAAQPLVGLFGKSLYAGVGSLTVGMTGLAQVAEGVVGVLNELGITSGTTAEVLAQLYITYKVSRWMISLGQGALFAMQGMYNAASGVWAIVPATVTASSGVMRLVGTLGILAAVGTAAFALFNNLDKFAGLEVDTGGMFPEDYNSAMDEYLAAMEEYNAAIEKYQQQFNAPYETIDDGADKAVTDIEDVEEASKKAAKAVQNDWVAAFDEVYQVPDQKDTSGGSGLELPEMPDLGALLKDLAFRFPSVGETELTMPEFPWEDVFSGGLLDDTALSQDFWKSWLPGIISAAIIGAAATAAKNRKARMDINADGAKGAKPDVDMDPKKAQAELTKLQQQQEKLLKRIQDNTAEITKKLGYASNTSYGVEGRPTTGLAGTVEQQRLLVKEFKSLNSTAGKYGAIIGSKVDNLAAIADDERALRSAQLLLNKQRLAAIEKELKAAGITQGQVADLLAEQKALLKENAKLALVAQGSDVSGLTADGLKQLIEQQAKGIVDGLDTVVSKALPRYSGTADALTSADVRNLFSAIDEFTAVGDDLRVMLPAWADSNATQAQRLYNYLTAQSKELGSIRKLLLSGDMPAIEALERFVASVRDVDTSALTGVNVRPQYEALVEPVQDAVKRLSNINDYVVQLTDEAITANKDRKAAEAARRAASEAAAANAAEQLRLAREAAIEAKKAAARAAAANLSYYPTGKQLAGMLDGLGIKRPTEAIALSDIVALDSRGVISQAVSEIKAGIKSIEASSLSDTAAIKSTLRAIDANMQLIRDNGGELRKNLDTHVRALARQFGVELSDATAAVVPKLNTLNALVAGFQDILPSSGLAATAGQAVAGGKLPPSLAKLFGSIENATQALLSGTTLGKATLGIGAFDGSDVDLIVKAFGDTFPGLKQLTKRDASFAVEIAKVMGNYLEPLVAFAAQQQWQTAGGEVMRGGYKAIADGVAQIDTTVKYNGKLLSNDIKTVSGSAAEAYKQGSKELLGAVRSLDADMLKLVRPEHFYQLGMQAAAFDDTRLGMTIFNRDFDIRDAADELYNVFIQKMQTYVPDGRIFSVDAVSRYDAINAGRFGNVEELVDSYVREVLLPTLGIPADAFDAALSGSVEELQAFADTMRKARLDVIGAATTPYMVNYTDAQIRALDVAGTSKAVKQLNELIAAVAHNDALPQFLHSYIVFNEQAGELAGTVAAIDLNSTLRQYRRMSESATKWAQNILKTSEKFDAGAISRKLMGTVDTLVNNYIYDVARLGSTDATALTQKTAEQLRALAAEARQHVNGAASELFAGTSATADNMSLFARSLETLADNLSDTGRTASLLRTVTDRIAGINAAIDAHAKVLPSMQQTFTGLGRNLEELFTLLGMSTNEAAIGVMRQIEQYTAIAKQLSGTQYFDELFGKIELPFHVASVKESARYTAKVLSDAVNDGLLTVADGLTKQFTADVSALVPDASGITIKFVGDLASEPLKIPASLFFDFETTDLITQTPGGAIMPEITQFSLLNEKTGEIYSWLIDHGERNAEILARMQSIDGVGEAWRAYSVLDLANGVSLNQAVQQIRSLVDSLDGTLTGYNAVNLIHAGGGFDAQLLKSLGIDLADRFSKDVMTQASQIMARYTGSYTAMDLSSLYAIATGAQASGAHNAATDVQMTAAIQQAITSGRFEQVVKNAAAEGFAGGIKNSLLAASNAITPLNVSTDVTEAVVEQFAKQSLLALPEKSLLTLAEEAARAAQEAADAAKNAQAAADTTGEAFRTASEIGADDAARRAAAGGADFWGVLKGMFREATSGGLFGTLSEEVKANFKTFWQRMTNAADSWAEAAKGTKGIQDIFDSWDTLVKYNLGSDTNPEKLIEGMSKLRARKVAAEWAVEMGAATANTDWVKQALKDYDDALTEYSKVSKAFYKAVTENIAGGLQGFENDKVIIQAINDLSDNAKYLAFTLDPETGAMKLISDNLLSSKDEIGTAFRQYAASFLEQSKIPVDSIDDFYEELLRAVASGNLDDLSDGAKVLNNAFNTFGQTAVIYDVSDDLTDAAARIKYAGTGAADAINSSADAVAGSFKNIGSRLINGIGGFGVIDVAAAGLEGIFQHFSDVNAGKQLQAYLGSSDDTSKIVEELAANGVNIGEQIGDNVYNAVGQAIGQGVVVGVVGSLAATAGAKIGAAIGTAIAPAIGTAIGAVAGAVVGTIGSFATDTVIKATGGKTATNLYLDDYIAQLNTGSVLTADMLAEAEEALGRALTEKEKADLEEQSRQMLTFQTMAGAKGGFWENDDINKVLYGSSSKTNDVELALRLATALEAFDTSKIGTFTQYDDYGGTSSKYVTVSDPDVVDQLEELLGVELELKELSGSANKVLYDATNNRYLEGTNANLEALGEAVKLLYTQGNSSSEITSEIQRIVDGNEALSEAVIASVGESTVMAAEALADYLPIYNEMTGLQLTMDYIDETMGLGAALIEQMTQMYDAITAEYLAQAEARKTDTWNRNVAAGDTSTTIWGANLAGVTQETLNELATFGIKLSEASTTIESELTGAIEQTYVTLQTSADTIKENLAGWQIDASNYAKLDFSQLTVTAEDAEILASAGIQINGDGTVTFMKAENAGNTGATRDLMLDATSFSDSVVAALQSKSIALDFEAKSLNFDTASLQENLTGAMFKLPDNFSAYASEQVKEALENIGDIMDSGYFMITDQAVLNGNRTIQGYLDGMIGAENVNTKVATALGNIDSLIHQEGATVAANIAEWADGIVMPSPIPKAQMTEEIEAAFKEIGVTFNDYAGQYMMTVEQAGEHLYDGITKIDKEKWMSLDASLRTALEDLGVTVTDVGNQVMVDLSGTFNNGINDVVNLFIAQPDVWNQIPESVRAYLEQAGIVSEEGWLVLKNIGEGKLTEIQGAWITLWDGISDETLNTQIETVDGTKTNLATLEAAVDDGLLKIAGVVDSSEIPELTENQIAVPFKNLPPEIQEALQGQEGLKGKLEGSNVILENATKSAFAGMLEELGAAATNAEDTANEMGTTIETAVVNAMSRIQQLATLSSQLGSTGALWWKEDNYLGSGQTVNGVTYYPEINSKGEIVKYWYFTPEGARKSTTSLPKKAEGGYAEGLTLTGELGREMAILPDGSIRMLGANGRGELVNLPKGTRVLSNEDTEAVLKYAGPVSSISKLAEGNADLTIAKPEDAGNSTEATLIGFVQQLIAAYQAYLVNDSGEEKTESQRDAANVVATAIRGAVAAITEFEEKQWAECFDELDEHFDDVRVAIEETSDSVTGAIGDLGTSISSLGSRLQSASLGQLNQSSGIGSSGAGTSAGAAKRPDSWYNSDGSIEFTTVVKDTGSVANAFKELGYVKNENGAWTKPKGSAKGSLVTKDALYRAGELGLNEAIIPLEQPDVLDKVGSAIGGYVTTGSAVTKEDIDAATQLLIEAWAVAVRGAVAAITENQVNYTNELGGKIEGIIDIVDENLGKLEALETLATAVDALSSYIQQINSEVQQNTETTATGFAELPVGLTAEFGQWFVDSLAAAREAYGSATTDADRAAAHQMAEDVRSLLGYSGGPDGSQYIPLSPSGDSDALTGIAEQLSTKLDANAASIIAQLVSIEKTGSTFYDQLLKSDVETYNKWSATYAAAQSNLQSIINAAAITVANAVGSYVNWSQNTISALQAEVASLRAALSSTSTRSTIKGSAKGSLVTKDALYRAGELGLNEAIIPLEQPSVMQQVGATIASYLPTSYSSTGPTSYSELFAKFDEQTEALAVAIRGAVAAVTENQGNYTTELFTKIEGIVDVVDENLGELESLDELTRAVTGLGNISEVLNSTTDKIIGAISEKLTEIDTTVTSIPGSLSAEVVTALAAQIAQAGIDYRNASSDDERILAHNTAEEARKILGYSGGPDGSQYIPLQDGFNTDNSEVFTELLTTQHTVIVECFSTLTEAVSTETKELQTQFKSLDVSLLQLNEKTATRIGSAASDIVVAVQSGSLTVANAVGSYVNWSQNTIASLQRQVASLQAALAAASSKKGSASGSLVTKDALYRAGEFGLNEAIIPLERPDVLKQVGSAIASFMPAERTQLSAVSGMVNAGVVAPHSAVRTQQDQMLAADSLAQRILEIVLPQIAYASAPQDEEQRRPLYVGNLIADEQGLKVLERKLYDIRQLESTRR